MPPPSSSSSSRRQSPRASNPALAGARRGAFAVLTAALLLAGCGASEDDPGSGTGTLRVIANGVIAGDFTDLALEISARGIPVVDAVITLNDTESGASATAGLRQPGFYVGRLSGDARVLRIDVQAGDDRLEAGIGGPRPFEITRPPAGARVVVGSAEQILLEWTRPGDEPADGVELSVVGSDNLPVTSARIEDDPGQGRVDLPTRTGPFRAVVTRTDVVPLAGGIDSSEIRLERSARVDFELTP